jgi:hypothetical protein
VVGAAPRAGTGRGNVGLEVGGMRGARRPERAEASGGSSPASERPAAGYPRRQ